MPVVPDFGPRRTVMMSPEQVSQDFKEKYKPGESEAFDEFSQRSQRRPAPVQESTPVSFTRMIEASIEA